MPRLRVPGLLRALSRAVLFSCVVCALAALCSQRAAAEPQASAARGFATMPTAEATATAANAAHPSASLASGQVKIYIPLINSGQGSSFPSPDDPSIPAAPPAVVSYYMKYTSGSQAYTLGHQLGESDENTAGKQDSIVVLMFGRPAYDDMTKSYGTILYDRDESFVSTADILTTAEDFASGYYFGSNSDRDSHVTIAIGTSNYGSAITAAHGQAWAQMINDFYTWLHNNPGSIHTYARQISAAGANDIETGYASPDDTRAWVQAYNKINSGHIFYDFGDAGGCPLTGDGSGEGLCLGGWTQDDIWDLAWGGDVTNTSFPLPEIYTTDSAQAQQWYQLVLHGIVSRKDKHSPKMYIQGSFTQYEACNQKDYDPNSRNHCNSGERNDATTGWKQLWVQLNLNDSRTAQTPPYATDIRYEPLNP